MHYVLIVGEGRSGTTWLLNLLDKSPRTHCRNEPDTIAESSPLARLPKPLVLTDAVAAGLERDWDAAVRWTATHFGRDLGIRGPKDHVWGFGRVLGLHRTINVRPRKILGKFIPSIRGGEWAMPVWVGSRRRLALAVPVLKTIQIPAWAAWAVANRPDAARIVHIVRHPGGFLNSWRNRHLAKIDEAVVRQSNRDRLKEIGGAFPEWRERFGDVDAMSVGESELWYWRYATETVHAAGDGWANYHLVLYEHLAADAVGVARRVYEFAELDWTPAIENRVRDVSTESEAIADAWRGKLPPADVSAVERVLAGSPMARWWG